MADHTHNSSNGTEPETRTIRWCHWHQDVTENGVLISAAERISGPPQPFYACPSCCERHELVPLGEHPR